MRSPSSGRVGSLAAMFIVPLGMAALWQIAVTSGLVSFAHLPAPAEIVQGGVHIARSGTLLNDTYHTLLMVVVSWLLANVIGIATGLVLGLSKTARTFSTTTVELLRPLPAIGFLPVAVVALGFSDWVEILVGSFAAVWPVLINTQGAVRNINPLLDEVARVYGLSRFQKAVKIVLPAAAPGVLVGARLSIGLALVVVIVVEMIGVPRGIGYSLVAAQQALRPGEMFFYIALSAALGLGLNALVTRSAARLMPGVAALADQMDR